MNKYQGFTLIELIITIAVLAIIATLAVPSFSNMMLSQNLNGSARNLVITLDKARSKAILERREITVIFNTNSATSFSDDDDTLNWMPSGQTILNSNLASISFRADGLLQDPTSNTPLANDLTLVLCDQTTNKAKFSKNIMISRIGAIQQSEQISGGCN